LTDLMGPPKRLIEVIRRDAPPTPPVAGAVRITPEMVDQALRDTDWAAVDAQTDEDIARNIASEDDVFRGSTRKRLVGWFSL
jgi:hypothetical protein